MQLDDRKRILDDLTIRPDGNGAYGLTPGGIWIPGGARIKPKPTAVDLFCGCGGFSLGFIQAGFEVVCAVERDFWASVTYLTNLGQWPMRIHFATPDDEARFEKALKRAGNKHRKAQEKAGKTAVGPGFPRCGEHRPKDRTPVRSFIFGDVKNVTGDVIRRVAGIDQLDCIIGGPPCQGFSRANSNRGPDDPRNPLVFEFARLITELRPNTFCMENVPEIATMRTPDGIRVLDQFAAILREGGYEAYDVLEKLRQTHPDATVVHRKSDKANVVDRTKSTKSEGTRQPSRKPLAETPLLDLAES